jgi:hypothetical protein
MSAGVPSRSENDLSEDERRLLIDAHAELRAAVAEYEPVLGQELRSGQPVPMVSVEAIAKAQAHVDAAEDRLWQLRERLLGSARPSWAPRASLVSDWFSDDDAEYDEVTDPARS